MEVIKREVLYFLICIPAVLLISFFCSGIAEAAGTTQLVIDKNLKPGMLLKDAIELIGPPERIKVINTGSVVIPYNKLGLSIEIMNNSTIIEAIHLQSSFEGRFESGLEIGADIQKILSLYKQPDIMTKDIIKYSDMGRIFKISQGKLVGADLYPVRSTLYRQVSIKETDKHEETPDVVQAVIPQEVREEVREEVRKEVREEVIKEVRKEVREEVIEEGREVLLEKDQVFELFGFKVKQSHEGVVITEIRSGSVAQYGGLKKGEHIRKASLKGYGVRNIYSVGGLEDILKKAILRGNKTINILQKGNRYFKVEVPEFN